MRKPEHLDTFELIRNFITTALLRATSVCLLQGWRMQVASSLQMLHATAASRNI